MSKLFTSLTTAFLAGAFLLCALGGIALLDEFARLPFYNTLPVVALLVNGTLPLLLWHNKKHIQVLELGYQRVAFPNRISFRWPASIFTNDRRERSTETPSVRETEIRRMRMPSAREIEIALGKIHSIAWGFPLSKRTVNLLGQEERSNHEARQ